MYNGERARERIISKAWQTDVGPWESLGNRRMSSPTVTRGSCLPPWNATNWQRSDVASFEREMA